ncbi:hypothetical protein [Citricoccus sp.]|nr:hypothetical protein [Citricoccus sp.]MBB5750441.1 hypothetical protein [Micrococcus sp. TA1]HRO29706.1 hypothetical protein [Citricoccus sp.]
MTGTPTVIVFDVNEPLSDMSAMHHLGEPKRSCLPLLLRTP